MKTLSVVYGKAVVGDLPPLQADTAETVSQQTKACHAQGLKLPGALDLEQC